MQEITETPSAGRTWRPGHPSIAAEAVWLAFGTGDTAGWSGGALTWPSPAHPDASFLPGGSGFSVPDWVEALMDELDSLLPSRERMEAALGPDSLTVVPGSPGFLIPCPPDPVDAGRCLLAARILLVLRSEVLPPMFSTCEECEASLVRAAATAVMMGGRAAFVHAASMACDPGTFDRVPAVPDVEMEVEGETDS